MIALLRTDTPSKDGFIVDSARSYSTYLLKLANGLYLNVGSVECRVAPENPFPVSQNDRQNAALLALSVERETKLGGKLRVLAGESARGHLVV